MSQDERSRPPRRRRGRWVTRGFALKSRGVQAVWDMQVGLSEIALGAGGYTFSDDLVGPKPLERSPGYVRTGSKERSSHPVQSGKVEGLEAIADHQSNPSSEWSWADDS
jgi:hypothetical protein